MPPTRASSTSCSTAAGLASTTSTSPTMTGSALVRLLSGMAKGGVFSAGAFEFVPRSAIIGHFLTGVLGAAAAPVDHPDSDGGHGYKHVITLQSADKFAMPYYTFRSKVGGLQGETFQDCRIMSLALNWRAADHVRAAMTVIGGAPDIQSCHDQLGSGDLPGSQAFLPGPHDCHRQHGARNPEGPARLGVVSPTLSRWTSSGSLALTPRTTSTSSSARSRSACS